MISTISRGVRYYRFSHLDAVAGLRHGVFGRAGGVSGGSYASLNVGFGIGDHEEHVRQNRRIVKDTLAAERLVFVDQVHGAAVVPVGPVANGSGGSLNAGTGDALVTTVPGLFLVIQVADCQPVLMVDPVRRVAANVHSGWRGSLANVVGAAVRAMVTRFDCRPADILAGIGPSLGPCCAEFVNYHDEIPRAFWPYQDHRHHFDFWAVSRDQLLAAGLRREHIALAGLCTKCAPERFFSYRHSRVTGRMAAVIGWD